MYCNPQVQPSIILSLKRVKVCISDWSGMRQPYIESAISLSTNKLRQPLKPNRKPIKLPLNSLKKHAVLD